MNTHSYSYSILFRIYDKSIQWKLKRGRHSAGTPCAITTKIKDPPPPLHPSPSNHPLFLKAEIIDEKKNRTKALISINKNQLRCAFR